VIGKGLVIVSIVYAHEEDPHHSSMQFGKSQ
jgi:hypothetical protein